MGRSVPSAASTHTEILAVVGDDFNGAKVAVGFEICWLVGQSVLAAEFVLDFGEGVSHIANLEGEKWAATCGIGLNNAMATGVNLLGDSHGGAGQQCVELLTGICAEQDQGADLDTAVATRRGPTRA